MLIAMVPILINKDVFEPSYKDLKFTIWNCIYVCTKNSSTLATSCKELIHWKRPWCLEGLGAGGEGDNRGWDGWMASLTRWAWVWVKSGSWWWTGRPGMLRFMGSQRVRHNWATEVKWIKYTIISLGVIPRKGISRAKEIVFNICFGFVFI